MGVPPLRGSLVRAHPSVLAVCAVLVLLLTCLPDASAGQRRVSLQGTYRAMAVDGYGWGRTDHYLTSSGRTYLLQRGGVFPDIASGTRVAIDGTLTGSDLSADTIEPLAAPTSLRSVPRLATDTRSVLAILVDWTAPDAVTPTSAVHQLQDVNDAWYDDASYGQVRMTAASTNWLAIAPPTGCDADAIMANAFSAATGAGWDLSAYDHLLVYFPYTGDCGWAGMAYVGWGRLWINGYLDTRVTVHELGHNLGLYHAHSLACTASGSPVPWSSTCTRTEYGDPFDAMGGSYGAGVGRFNAAQADQLDWMQGRKHTVAAPGGTYVIAPLSRRAEATQALRLPGTAHDIWVEYRDPAGVDSWLPSGGTGGVLLHVPADIGGSDFLDMSPAGDVTDAVLGPGDSWVDPATDWAIRVDAVDAEGATVTVNKTADTSPPVFTVKPRVAFAAPQQLPGSGTPVKVRVRWAAKDMGDAVTGYDVRAAENGGAWTTLASDDPAASTTVAAKPEHTITVQVRATDGWGNASAWTAAPPIGLRTFSEERLTYKGHWSVRRDRHAIGRSYRFASHRPSSVVTRVRARAVALLARTGPNFGSVRAIVDGKAAGAFSARASADGWRRLTIRLAWLHAGLHRIRLVNMGIAGHAGFAVDGFAILR